ncbi:MAG: PQQ-binding-like beta-propeller repeat protein [Alphaproteobacteria bacterium]|jgi:outer membrane protein assembly factor BamB
MTALRSTFAARALLGAALAITPVAASLAAFKTIDWGQTYSDYGHTGYNPREKTLSAANVSSLKLNWARSLPGDVRAFVVNDRSVVLRVPSDDGQSLDLWDLNYTTGETVWKIATGPDVAAANNTMATGSHRIFTECGLVDDVGYKYSGICGYRKTDGKLVYQFSSPCNCTPEAKVVTSVVYAHGIIFFGYFMGGVGGQEYAIAADAVTGEIYEAYSTGGQNSLGSAPSVQGGHQVYFDCSNSVCALGHRNGNLRWKSDVGAPIGALSADRSHRLYANLCNGTAGLVALDQATGAPLWSYGAGECNGTPAAIAKDHIYFTGADTKVHALDALSGAELWATPAGAASSASVANGVMYVGGIDSAPATTAYDAQTGALLWNTEPHASPYRLPPEIIDGMVFVANEQCGSLCAYGLPSPKGK